MASKACSRSDCGMAKSADVHSRHYKGADGHPYVLDGPVGLQPVSEGVRNYRRVSGYDHDLAKYKGTPCQIASPVCTGYVEHLHEPMPRGRAGGLEAAVEIGGRVPGCDACNRYCSQEGQVWAAEHGFLFRNTEDGRRAAREAKERRDAVNPRPNRRMSEKQHIASDTADVGKSAHMESAAPASGSAVRSVRSKLK